MPIYLSNMIYNFPILYFSELNTFYQKYCYKANFIQNCLCCYHGNTIYLSTLFQIKHVCWEIYLSMLIHVFPFSDQTPILRNVNFSHFLSTTLYYVLAMFRPNTLKCHFQWWEMPTSVPYESNWKRKTGISLN